MGQAVFHGSSPPTHPRKFLLGSILCHCLLFVVLQHAPLIPSTSQRAFEPVHIKVVDLPEQDFFEETVPTRTLVSRRTLDQAKGVLREPFAWELTEKHELEAAIRRVVSEPNLPEELQKNETPLPKAFLPEQAVTAVTPEPVENHSAPEVIELQMHEPELAQRDAPQEPLALPEELSVAAIPLEVAESFDFLLRPAENHVEIVLAARPVQDLEVRTSKPVELSDSPAPNEAPVTAELPHPRAVSSAREEKPLQQHQADWVIPQAAAEPAPMQRRRAGKMIVGRLVSIAEAEANADHRPVTTLPPRLADARGEFISFVSVRNEGTAPVLMRQTEGSFGAKSPQLVEIGDWGEISPATESMEPGGFSSPQYRTKDKPPYPRIAREREYEGKVVLKVKVLANGKVGDVILQESSGYKMLDHSAVEAVRRWQFYPAKKNGAPADHWTIITVEFRLVEG